MNTETVTETVTETAKLARVSLHDMRLEDVWKTMRDNYHDFPVVETSYRDMYVAVLSIMYSGDDGNPSHWPPLTPEEVTAFNANGVVSEKLPLPLTTADPSIIRNWNAAVTIMQVTTKDICGEQVVLGMIYAPKDQRDKFRKQVEEKAIKFKIRGVGSAQDNTRRVLTWDMEEIKSVEEPPAIFQPQEEIRLTCGRGQEDLVIAIAPKDRFEQICIFLEMLTKMAIFDAFVKNGELNIAELSECTEINPSYQKFFSILLDDLCEFAIEGDHLVNLEAVWQLGSKGYGVSQDIGDCARIDEAPILITGPNWQITM